MTEHSSLSTESDASSLNQLRIALVSAYPPTRGNLAEYANHLVRAYLSQENVTVDVMATEATNAPKREKHPSLNVYRLWEPDVPSSALHILQKIRENSYDVVHFNARMSYFGSDNFARFIGLLLPVIVRLGLRVPVVVTLHDLFEIVDEESLPESIGVLERFGASLATQFALLSNVTTVTHRKYKRAIEEKYPAHNVKHVPHGTFTSNRTLNARRDPFCILLFGHLSPTKDYATVFEAFERLKSDKPNVELLVAGDSHPNHPDMRPQLEQKYGARKGVRFLGYVPEKRLEDVFESSSVLVLPYKTCPGVSGVYHLAKTFATPTIAYDTQEMREATIATGGVVEFVEPESPSALASTIAEFKENPHRLEKFEHEMRQADTGPSLDETAKQLTSIMRRITDD